MSDFEKLRSEVAWRLGKKVKSLGGIDTDDLRGLVKHLDQMVAVNKRLLHAVEQIADDRSPFDGTGEPLQVRIAKDLTRRM